MDMSNKVCLITGANSGIGKATAKKLAEKGAYVVMVCRNKKKAEIAKQDIIDKTGHAGIDILLADLALQHDVHRIADEFRSKFDALDVLINNAGMIPSNRQETEEGIEKTFAVNHLAPFLLTNLLLESLKAVPNARVITVSSEAHRAAARFFDLNNLQLASNFTPMKAYGLSKLYNIMFTHELAKRTADTGITANALHPGVVRSDLTSEASWGMYLLFMFGKPFMKTPERGAETSIYLATSDEVRDTTGRYFKNKKVVAPADIAIKNKLTEQLWKLSKELTGID